MEKSNEKNIRALLEEYRPVYRRLYYIACATAGNDRAAERALARVMLSVPVEAADRAIVRAAREARAEMGGETNFQCLLGDVEAGELADKIACLSDEGRRAAMLRFGVGMPAGEIANMLQIPAGKVRRYLNQCLTEAAKNGQSDDPEKELEYLCLKEINENEMAPDMNTLMRAAEKESARAPKPRRRFHLRRTANWLTAAALLLILGVMVWCGVVLLDYFRQSPAETGASRVGQQTMITEEFHACV